MKRKNLIKNEPEVRRVYVSQNDVPRIPLSDAVRVAQAIADNYAKQPTKPLRVAEALRMAPTTSTFRVLTSASSAYGLTDGTAWANEISITELGRRIVAPTEEGDDLAARVEAVLKPRVVRDFLEKYNGSKMPSTQIANNVLQEMGVPRDASSRTLSVILKNAQDLGLLRDIKGQLYVDLTSPSRAFASPGKTEGSEASPDAGVTETTRENNGARASIRPVGLQANRKVFITHGSNQQIVQQLKEILVFGNFEPVVSVERETTAKSVPDKVLDDMRACGAAIVHVGSERKLMDANGNEVAMLNPNVLIEIGAAMALYGKRFILLVERGVSLPSNLQGLYEIRYEGTKLDYDSTMKLLKAFNDFKS